MTQTKLLQLSLACQCQFRTSIENAREIRFTSSGFGLDAFADVAQNTLEQAKVSEQFCCLLRCEQICFEHPI